MRQRQQRQRRRGRGHGQKRHHRRRRNGVQPQAGRGDDAQRAFGPDQKMAQVIACIVLAQPGKAVEDGAVGQNRL